MNNLTLWNDEFAPVTSSIGFLRAPLHEVACALADWQQRNHGSVSREHLAGGLRENIHRLEPLTSAIRPRKLLVQTKNAAWTAIFDCGYRGGDPTSTAGYLAELLATDALAITSIPDWTGEAPATRFGARQFQIFGPERTHFLNYVRGVHLVQDGTRWSFELGGVQQWFEEPEHYTAKRVKDRFTVNMLARYAAALGLDPFDGDFYGGPCELVEVPSFSKTAFLTMSIREAQNWVPQ